MSLHKFAIAALGAAMLFCLPASEADARILGRRAARQQQQTCIPGPGGTCVAPSLTYQGGTGLTINARGGFEGQLPDSYYQSYTGGIAPVATPTPVATVAPSPPAFEGPLLVPATVPSVREDFTTTPTMYPGPIVTDTVIVPTEVTVTTHPTAELRNQAKELAGAHIPKAEALEMLAKARADMAAAEDAVRIASLDEMFQARIEALKIEQQLQVAQIERDSEIARMQSQLQSLQTQIAVFQSQQSTETKPAEPD